jgi:hypothetical protein
MNYDMQREWDSLLISYYYYDPYARIGQVGMKFKGRFGIFPSETKILRKYNANWQMKQTVSRFIAYSLPKLYLVLCNHGKDKATKIIDTLQKSKMDSKNDYLEDRKTKAESVLFDKSAKEYAKSQIMYKAFVDEKVRSNELRSRAGIKMRRAK